MIKYITYGGVKYPLRISHYAIKGFEIETGESLDSLDKKTSNLEIILWYALIAGHKAENKVLTLKREDMEWVLDESLIEFNQIVLSSVPFAAPTETTGNKKK